jgi:hypothetical protein
VKLSDPQYLVSTLQGCQKMGDSTLLKKFDEGCRRRLSLALIYKS